MCGCDIYFRSKYLRVPGKNPHTIFFFYSRKNHHIGESRFVRDETLFGLVIIVIKVLFRLVFIDAVLHLIPFILI